MAAGYRTVEYVIEAFAESLRRRPEAGPRGEAAGPRARREGPATRRGGDTVSGTVPGDLADLTAELFDRFGETLHAVADAIGERRMFERGPSCPKIELAGPPGATVDIEFRFTNTGASALVDVGFEVSDLIGATDRIEAGRVGIAADGDERIRRVRPGGSAVAGVAVKIPEEAAPGVYRGVITARPAAPGRGRATERGPDTWALLELEVTPPVRGRSRDDERGAEDEGTTA